MNVTLALVVHAVVLTLVAAYLRWRVKRIFSFTGLSLGLLALIHGIPVFVYLLFTGPDTFIFEASLERVDREATLAQLPLALSLMFVMFLTGVELARNVSHPALQGSGRVPRSVARGPLVRLIYLGSLSRQVLWTVALGMLAVSVLENQLGKTFEYFASGESELGKILLRVEEGGTPYYLYNLLLSSVAPFLVMVAICAARNQPRRRSLTVLACLFFVAVLLGKFGTLSKAPPVVFMLQLVLLVLLLRRQRLNLRNLLLLVGMSLTLFVTIVRSTIPDLDLLEALGFLYYRMFDIPNEVLLEYFAAVPATLPYGGGGGIFSFLRTVPDDQFIPMMSAVAEVTRDSLISTSNAMFVGDAWAEFGWAGIASFSFIAGFLMRAIDGLAFKDGESDLSACLVAGGSYGIFTMLSTALNTAMLTGGLLLLPVVAYLLMRARPGQARLSPTPAVQA